MVALRRWPLIDSLLLQYSQFAAEPHNLGRYCFILSCLLFICQVLFPHSCQLNSNDNQQKMQKREHRLNTVLLGHTNCSFFMLPQAAAPERTSMLHLHALQKSSSDKLWYKPRAAHIWQQWTTLGVCFHERSERNGACFAYSYYLGCSFYVYYYCEHQCTMKYVPARSTAIQKCWQSAKDTFVF